MKKSEKQLTGLFVLIMLAFSLLMAAWVPLRAALDFSMADTALSLETSRGRERKQQMEYDQVLKDLPAAREELAEIHPRAEAAAEQVRLLKEERKALRAKKKQLESEQKSLGNTDPSAQTAAGEEP